MENADASERVAVGGGGVRRAGGGGGGGGYKVVPSLGSGGEVYMSRKGVYTSYSGAAILSLGFLFVYT